MNQVKMNLKTKKTVLMGVLLAVGILLDISPFSAIPIGSVSATINLIPVIIGGIILGPIYGLYLGIGMGVVSLLHAMMRPVTPFDILFINPLLSVLPRAFIGVVSAYVHAWIRKWFGKEILGYILGAAAGSLTNTVLVLVMMYFLYAPRIIEMAATIPGLELTDAAAVRSLLYGIGATNGLMEAIVAAVVTVTVCIALKQGKVISF